ncbi:hypothetical protein [Brevibacillus choshinensis]|uniref:Uncharacterized protein n=1 Tax=Brevibacillus choshinensis TaxID=54911 RepID=A0ABX7FLR1_BRECH|nr:hypothetical protein [Brevibacillus choshinensis]QRG66247.1 hypothetical protein JNE38_22255 [Brevibacillus choshinensis]
MNQVTKKYQAIDQEIVLFNDEYYLSVVHLDISPLNTPERESLFTHLFEFESNDIELEIDVSEEHEGKWYLQVLVPHVLTLPDVARKRLERGREELATHWAKQSVNPTQAQLCGEDIYQYVKRYNPNLQVIG